jgi:hypothetical protein
MAAFFSSIHFVESGAPSARAPVISTRRAAAHPTPYLVEIAARAGAAIGKAVLLLWTMLALGFSLLVIAGFFV